MKNEDIVFLVFNIKTKLLIDFDRRNLDSSFEGNRAGISERFRTIFRFWLGWTIKFPLNAGTKYHVCLPNQVSFLWVDNCWSLTSWTKCSHQFCSTKGLILRKTWNFWTFWFFQSLTFPMSETFPKNFNECWGTKCWWRTACEKLSWLLWKQSILIVQTKHTRLQFLAFSAYQACVAKNQTPQFTIPFVFTNRWKNWDAIVIKIAATGYRDASLFSRKHEPTSETIKTAMLEFPATISLSDGLQTKKSLLRAWQKLLRWLFRIESSLFIDTIHTVMQTLVISVMKIPIEWSKHNIGQSSSVLQVINFSTEPLIEEL